MTSQVTRELDALAVGGENVIQNNIINIFSIPKIPLLIKG
jgi:hypothetical protein